MPTAVDLTFIVFFAVIIAGAEAVYFDRRFKAQVAAGVPTARRNAYRRATLGQWALAIVAVVLWAREGRPWSALGVVPPHDWRLIVGAAIVAIVALLVAKQNRSIRRVRPNRRQELRGRFAGVEFLMPHTSTEYRWFAVLSVTAGVCEELLYRGFLMWVVASFTGTAAALIIVAVAFGLAHAYQGLRGILKTGSVGLVVGLIVLASGWLVPAMIVHALVDISAGVVGFNIFSEPPAEVAAAA